MRKKIVYKYITAGVLSLAAAGVSASPLRVVVTDADTGAPVEFAAMALTQGDSNIGALTDAEGVFAADPAPGKWMLTVSAVGYTAVHREIKIGADTSVITIALKPTYTQIGEVVVTAREGRGMTSASLIDQTAMQHLQPSSFTDLMEMLPGAVSKDPEMGKANLATCVRQKISHRPTTTPPHRSVRPSWSTASRPIPMPRCNRPATPRAPTDSPPAKE